LEESKEKVDALLHRHLHDIIEGATIFMEQYANRGFIQDEETRAGLVEIDIVSIRICRESLHEHPP